MDQDKKKTVSFDDNLNVIFEFDTEVLEPDQPEFETEVPEPAFSTAGVSVAQGPSLGLFVRGDGQFFTVAINDRLQRNVFGPWSVAGTEKIIIELQNGQIQYISEWRTVERGLVAFRFDTNNFEAAFMHDLLTAASCLTVRFIDERLSGTAYNAVLSCFEWASAPSNNTLMNEACPVPRTRAQIIAYGSHIEIGVHSPEYEYIGETMQTKCLLQFDAVETSTNTQDSNAANACFISEHEHKQEEWVKFHFALTEPELQKLFWEKVVLSMKGGCIATFTALGFVNDKGACCNSSEIFFSSYSFMAVSANV